MRLAVLSGVALLSGASVASVFAPVAEVTGFVQDGSSAQVTISYSLDAAAIVTVDILTNGCSVGGANMMSLSGDVNRLFAAGPHAVTWRPEDEAWTGLTAEQRERARFPVGTVRAVVTAWSERRPPNFMVINLDDTSDVRYFPDRSFFPGVGGLTNDLYKTDYLVMRLCPAGKGMEGAVESEASVWQTTTKPRHEITLTRDFYLGVYPLTQRQYEKLSGKTAECYFSGGVYLNCATRPFDFGRRGSSSAYNWTQSKVRVGTTGKAWPKDRHDGVGSDSLIATFRTKLGGLKVDLPTATQWEYACRAGEKEYSSFPDGLGVETSGSSASASNRVEALGWISTNSTMVNSDGSSETQTHPVGEKAANAWDFYDLCGNVYEVCLDLRARDSDYYSKMAADPSLCIDPTGPESGYPDGTGQGVVRGGDWHTTPGSSFSSACENAGSGWGCNRFGLRLCCELEFGDDANL